MLLLQIQLWLQLWQPLLLPRRLLLQIQLWLQLWLLPRHQLWHQPWLLPWLHLQEAVTRLGKGARGTEP